MPVEIRELVIRATVEEDPESAAARGNPPAASGGPSPGAESKQRDRLLSECVERAMETLNEQKER